MMIRGATVWNSLETSIIYCRSSCDEIRLMAFFPSLTFWLCEIIYIDVTESSEKQNYSECMDRDCNSISKYTIKFLLVIRLV